MNSESLDFAPADPGDGRRPLEWKSNYRDREAARWILAEATYLGLLLAVVPVSLVFLWVGGPRNWFGLSEARYGTFLTYSFAWIGGMFGGTLFDIKWLYHSVAKKKWHLDRRLWRFFTPHLSGGLAFAVTALMASGVVRLFNSAMVDSRPAVFGTAFLVGYFSDNTVAKLAEVAGTLFGGSSRSDSKEEPSDLTAK